MLLIAAAAAAVVARAGQPPEPEPWPSVGCKQPSSYSPPLPTDTPNRLTVKVNDPNIFDKYRNYYLYLPPSYNGSKPLPVVFYFPSFYTDAQEAYWTTKLFWESGQMGGNFIIAIPNGENDCGQRNCEPQGMETVSWNAWGSGHNGPGPLGPICDPDRSRFGEYPCYSSCQAISPDGTCNPCVSSSCANDTLFFETVLNDVKTNFCVDDRRLYVTGMSVGAMFGLQIATLYSNVLAGAALAAPGVIYGWWKPPSTPIPMMDIHGHFDDIIPANFTNSFQYPVHSVPNQAPEDCSFSQDGFFYMPSYNWSLDIARVNKCNMSRNTGGWPPNGSWIPWKTCIDGMAGWQCGLPYGECPTESPLVRCTWNGMHELPLVGKRTEYRHHKIPPSGLNHTQKVHAFARVAWEFLKPFYRTGNPPPGLG